MTNIAKIQNEDPANTPEFEVIENGNDIYIRIAVPGRSNKEIEVRTLGTQLFVRTVCDKKLQKDARRLSGSYLSPKFQIEFVIDNNITVGSPSIERGVLTIPMMVDPEIKMEVRDYSVRELSKADATPGGTDNWVFKNSYN